MERGTIRRLVREGRVRHRKAGRKLLLNKADVDKALFWPEDEQAAEPGENRVSRVTMRRTRELLS